MVKEQVKEMMSRLGNRVAPQVKQGMEEALNVIILERRIDERLRDAKDLDFLDDDQVIEMVRTNLASQIPFMRGGDLESKYQRKQMKAYSKLLHIMEWMKDGLMIKKEIHRHKGRMIDGKLVPCGSSLQVREYPALVAMVKTKGGEEIITESGKIRNLYCPICVGIVLPEYAETETIKEVRDNEAGEYLDAMKRIVAWASRKIYVIAWRSEDLESRPIALQKNFPDFGGGNNQSSGFMEMLMAARQAENKSSPTLPSTTEPAGSGS